MRSRDARWILSKSWHNQPFAPDPFASEITKFAVSYQKLCLSVFYPTQPSLVWEWIITTLWLRDSFQIFIFYMILVCFIIVFSNLTPEVGGADIAWLGLLKIIFSLPWFPAAKPSWVRFSNKCFGTEEILRFDKFKLSFPI